MSREQPVEPAPDPLDPFAKAWGIVDKAGRLAAHVWTEDQAIAEQAWQDEHNARFSPHRIEKPRAPIEVLVPRPEPLRRIVGTEMCNAIDAHLAQAVAEAVPRPAVDDVLMALHYAASTAESAAHDLAGPMQRKERHDAYEEAEQAIRALAVQGPAIEDRADAERYRWLRGDAGPHSSRWPRWNVQHWNGVWNPVSGADMDAAIDAAMKEGP